MTEADAATPAERFAAARAVQRHPETVAFSAMQRFDLDPFQIEGCHALEEGRSVLVGVISWSTGPNGTAGCGGMTGVTPLSLYRDWILQTARSWGAGI